MMVGSDFIKIVGFFMSSEPVMIDQKWWWLIEVG